MFILLVYILAAYITPYASIFTYIILTVSILIMACILNYEKILLSLLSKFSLVAASGEISGASRMGAYKSSESKELQRLKKF